MKQAQVYKTIERRVDGKRGAAPRLLLWSEIPLDTTLYSGTQENDKFSDVVMFVNNGKTEYYQVITTHQKDNVTPDKDKKNRFTKISHYQAVATNLLIVGGGENEGETLIKGDYINTKLIKAESIDADMINTKGLKVNELESATGTFTTLGVKCKDNEIWQYDNLKERFPFSLENVTMDSIVWDGSNGCLSLWAKISNKRRYIHTEITPLGVYTNITATVATTKSGKTVYGGLVADIMYRLQRYNYIQAAVVGVFNANNSQEDVYSRDNIYGGFFEKLRADGTYYGFYSTTDNMVLTDYPLVSKFIHNTDQTLYIKALPKGREIVIYAHKDFNISFSVPFHYGHSSHGSSGTIGIRDWSGMVSLFCDGERWHVAAGMKGHE